MTRNTENRVEICCPIEDRIIKQKINSIIDIILKDNVKSRELEKDGVYRYRHRGEIPINSQEIFMTESETFWIKFLKRRFYKLKVIYIS